MGGGLRDMSLLFDLAERYHGSVGCAQDAFADREGFIRAEHDKVAQQRNAVRDHIRRVLRIDARRAVCLAFACLLRALCLSFEPC